VSTPQGLPSPAEDAPILAAARDRVQHEVAAAEAVGTALDSTFVAAVRLVLAATGKVIAIGVGTSGPVARRMAHLLSTSGTPSLFLHPADALHGSLGAISAGDVVLAISKGGRSDELNEFAARAKRRGAALLVLTAAADSPLGQLADVTVVLPQTAEGDPGGVIAMGSSLAAAVWGDALAIVLMQSTGYGWDKVMDTHPSGAVGEREGLPPDLPQLHVPAQGPAVNRVV
jgi:D-arabinose 5-phosphate isomerase GutQ